MTFSLKSVICKRKQNSLKVGTCFWLENNEESWVRI